MPYKFKDTVDEMYVKDAYGETYFEVQAYYNKQYYNKVDTVSIQLYVEPVNVRLTNIPLNELRNLALFLINVAEKVDNANKN